MGPKRVKQSRHVSLYSILCYKCLGLDSAHNAPPPPPNLAHLQEEVQEEQHHGDDTGREGGVTDILGRLIDFDTIVGSIGGVGARNGMVMVDIRPLGRSKVPIRPLHNATREEA